MAKKERFTEAELLKDIKTSIKQTTHSPKNKKHNDLIKIIAILFGIGFVVIEIIYPAFVLWFFLLLIIALPTFSIYEVVKLKRKLKSVRIEDYEISTGILTDIEHERYTVSKGHKWYSGVEVINNYTMTFDNRDVWCVPKDNYLWCEERPMSDAAICQSSQIGDLFTVVRKRSTGKIVMAYPAEYFEYKEK